jgi:ribose 5-phosphate isomerase B
LKVFIGCDHAAFEEKEVVKKYIQQKFEVVDCGTNSAERCDYPDFAMAVAKEVQADNGVGVLLCGSGIGVSMAANRFAGVRAALCRSAEDAKLSRQHNNSNVICVGARTTSVEDIKQILDAWFSADFEEGRHTGRIDKFNQLGERH